MTMTRIFSTSVVVILTCWVFGEEISSLMRRKRRRADCLYDGEDLINQLPDDVLVLIIARIPTKTAVSTSVLSKRWRNLYKSLSTINLCCTDFLGMCNLCCTDFLGMCPCPHGYIKKIIHNIFLVAANWIKPEGKRFEQYLYYLGNSKVEKLGLSFHVCLCSVHRPFTSFSCDLVSQIPTLKYLELEWCIAEQPRLKSKWKSLTTLSLSNCTLVPGFCECILSNCLNLESLLIHFCQCPPKLFIRGPSLQLKTLSITYSENFEEIELHASNLFKIEYTDRKMVNWVFDHVPKLEIMLMSTSSLFGQWINMMTYIFGEFAKYVPNLRFLKFSTEPHFNQGMLIGRSKFMELRVLQMTFDYKPTGTNLLKLIPYLGSFPVLEELQLRYKTPSVGAVNVNVSNEVIELRRLKKVEINGFQGSSNEMEFALYILKNAPSLLQMGILIHFWKACYAPGEWRERIRHEETCENNIKQNLLGQALSPTATLIIRRQSNPSCKNKYII